MRAETQSTIEAIRRSLALLDSTYAAFDFSAPGLAVLDGDTTEASTSVASRHACLVRYAQG